MAIRVILSMTFPTAEAAEAELHMRLERCPRVEADEPGCLQFEIYRSAMKPEKLVLIELWESEARFDQHWRLPRPAQAPSASSQKTIEFYIQKVFANVDGVMAAAEPERRVDGIRWY